ncbi:hypothetical protein ONZ45_g15199 [Pleurotus djamor]|nr:hypothetical protein ONZ45_g15199 [Pleurotus djamor]
MVISGFSAFAFLNMVSDIGHKLELYVPFNFASTAGPGLECLGCYIPTPTGETSDFASVMQRLEVELSSTTASATPTDDKRPPYLVRDDGLAYGQDPSRYQNKHIYTVIPYKGPLGTDIDLVVYVCSLPSLLTAFHSSCLMNIITANVCFSVFPRETVLGRLSLSIQSPVVRQDDVRLKYTSYGVTIIENGIEACVHGAFKPGRRSVQDGNITCISMAASQHHIVNTVDEEFGYSVFNLAFTADAPGHAVITCLERTGHGNF